MKLNDALWEIEIPISKKYYKINFQFYNDDNLADDNNMKGWEINL